MDGSSGQQFLLILSALGDFQATFDQLWGSHHLVASSVGFLIVSNGFLNDPNAQATYDR